PRPHRRRHSFPTRRSSDLRETQGPAAERRGTQVQSFFLSSSSSSRKSKSMSLMELSPGSPPAPGARRSNSSSSSAGLGLPAGLEDRKSTRLNSSHVSISYA